MTTKNPVSPKISHAAVGGATATLLWVLAAAVWPGFLDAAALAAATGATAVILGALLGYLARDPQRHPDPPVPEDGWHFSDAEEQDAE